MQTEFLQKRAHISKSHKFGRVRPRLGADMLYTLRPTDGDPILAPVFDEIWGELGQHRPKFDRIWPWPKSYAKSAQLGHVWPGTGQAHEIGRLRLESCVLRAEVVRKVKRNINACIQQCVCGLLLDYMRIKSRIHAPTYVLLHTQPPSTWALMSACDASAYLASPSAKCQAVCRMCPSTLRSAVCSECLYVLMQLAAYACISVHVGASRHRPSAAAQRCPARPATNLIERLAIHQSTCLLRFPWAPSACVA